MRIIRNHGVDPTSTGVRIDDRCAIGCWFELHRQGGCGPGELRLERGFDEAADLRPGDWVSVSVEEDGSETRLYLGRVEHWEADHPAGVRVRLGGMVNELGEVFVGGFGAPGEPAPHRLGRTDLFTDDPDHPAQSHDETEEVLDVVLRLIAQYILPRTNVQSVVAVDVAQNPPVDSMILRGEESVRSLLKDLAVRAGNVDWGIDAHGRFFFTPGPETVDAAFAAGQEITRLSQTRSRDILFNRLQITGGHVYERPPRSGAVARPAHRTRYHFVHDESLTAFGEHRLRIWLPWIRTRGDAGSFASRFFDRYGQPVTKTLIEAVLPKGVDVPLPWEGAVEVRDETGSLLAVGRPEAIRISFDEAITLRMEIGPEDPRRLWAEPHEDERYEVAPRSEVSSSEESSSEELSGSGISSGPGTGDPGFTSSDGSSLISLASSSSGASSGSEGSTGSLASTGSSWHSSTAWTSSWSWSSDSSSDTEASGSTDEADSSDGSSEVGSTGTSSTNGGSGSSGGSSTTGAAPSSSGATSSETTSGSSGGTATSAGGSSSAAPPGTTQSSGASSDGNSDLGSLPGESE